MKNIIFILALFYFLTSCVKEIQFEKNEHKTSTNSSLDLKIKVISGVVFPEDLDWSIDLSNASGTTLIFSGQDGFERTIRTGSTGSVAYITAELKDDSSVFAQTKITW